MGDRDLRVIGGSGERVAERAQAGRQARRLRSAPAWSVRCVGEDRDLGAIGGEPSAIRAPPVGGDGVIAETPPADKVMSRSATLATLSGGPDQPRSSPLCRRAQRRRRAPDGIGSRPVASNNRIRDAVAPPAGVAVDKRHDHGVGVDLAETPVKDARIARHVEEAVRLPMDVGEFGDHVAGDGGVRTDRLDLVFEIAELVPLHCVDEAVERAEDAVEMKRREALLDAVRIGGTISPERAGLQPPRLAPVGFGERPRPRQSPGAEFRQDERLLTGFDRVAMRAERPFRAAGELFGELVPFLLAVRAASDSSGSR